MRPFQDNKRRIPSKPPALPLYVCTLKYLKEIPQEMSDSDDKEDSISVN